MNKRLVIKSQQLAPGVSELINFLKDPHSKNAPEQKIQEQKEYNKIDHFLQSLSDDELKLLKEKLK